MKIKAGLVLWLLMPLSAAVAQGQQEHNGFWWAGMSNDYKLGFVSGFATSITELFDARSFECLSEKGEQAITECVQKKVVPFDFTNIRLGQLADGVDEFYKDFRNKGIGIGLGLRYVRDELKGRKSAKELEEELTLWRRTAQPK